MKKTWMRVGVAAAAVGALGIGMVGTASADEPEAPNPTRGEVVTESGWTVHGAEGSSVDKVRASHIWLQPEEGGDPLETYCIDIHTQLKPQYTYEESTWDDSGVANLELVQWVLHNGYPSMSGADLAEAAGADVEGLGDETLDDIAYTATQTAVWTLTDEFKLSEKDATEADENVDKAVLAVNNYLVDNAEKMPEPSTEITIDGPEVINTAEKAGPFTVNTPGGEAAVEIKGGKIVDENDEELETVADGGEFWIIPDDDAAEITVDAKSQVAQPTGSVFMAIEGNNEPHATKESKLSKVESQRLILAASLEGEVEVTQTYKTETEDTLPVTGMSLTNSLMVGAGLLLAGAAALVIFKRRRVAATWGDAA